MDGYNVIYGLLPAWYFCKMIRVIGVRMIGLGLKGHLRIEVNVWIR